MKYKYRGQLNNGDRVDIFDFDGEYAKCDHGKGKIHIDDFNTIFFPRDVFKIDILNMEIEKVEKKPQPRQKKKSS